MENTGDNSKSLKTRPEIESETQIPNFPIIKQGDNSKLLPRYTARKYFNTFETKL